MRPTKGQVLPCGEVVEEGEVFGNDSDTAFDSPGGFGIVKVGVEDSHGTAGRCEQAGEHLDGGRLAGPVGTEEAEELAGLDTEVELIDSPNRPETAGKPVGFNREHGWGFLFSCRRNRLIVAGSHVYLFGVEAPSL